MIALILYNFRRLLIERRLLMMLIKYLRNDNHDKESTKSVWFWLFLVFLAFLELFVYCEIIGNFPFNEMNVDDGDDFDDEREEEAEDSDAESELDEEDDDIFGENDDLDVIQEHSFVTVIICLIILSLENEE